eukprot:TRINITY_DN111717_c0_g1_i1.p1 TRINITY_DN111717_c0_g1~~TRINITY_DN111717_c0_g1_i1.p1  ORF type:complete len:340 (+),score=33.18 TRINITY_DN111717_c0_g1_i1:60-1079(+)
MLAAPRNISRLTHCARDSRCRKIVFVSHLRSHRHFGVHATLNNAKRAQLLRDGYCVLPNILERSLLDSVLAKSVELAEAMPDEEKEKHKFTGSLIPTVDEEFQPLLTNPKMMEGFDALGYAHERVRFMTGFVISKPAHAPSLAWHQDCAVWDHDVAYEDRPHQLFAMYYLQDTSAENGCLRVIPGTHRKRHRMHDVLLNTKAHSDEVRSAVNWEDLPEHSDDPDAVDVPVKAGDVVIGDNRVLHAARRNASDKRRTLITLWYHPEYPSLPDRVKDVISSAHCAFSAPMYRRWSQGALDNMRPLLPDLRGYSLDAGVDHDQSNHSLDTFDRVVRVERLHQ